jgi:hypothetical protein
MSYYQMVHIGDGAYAKETMEDTTHTAHLSPKMVSFSDYPLLQHSTSQRKIRVYSNSKLTSTSQQSYNKVI